VKALGAHEVSYSGRLHVRAADRGVTLADADGRLDVEGWVEQALHAEVCSGQLTLRHAQKLIAGDWVAAYRARFG
jgi:hypothetical protein